nr:zinc finger, CCHC-type [Tanacetum cinerariifolium]
MTKGSLADILFAPKEGNPKPCLMERIRMAIDIARGIVYLHEECEQTIIHCDVKPHNILMDEYGCAKISDFGLAKLLENDETRTNTLIRGTRGYVAPDWQKNKQAGEKKKRMKHKRVFAGYTRKKKYRFCVLTVWALRIKTILGANGLWDIIEPMDNAQLDIKKDMAATAFLYQALPEDMILQVASCNSAKEIWEALQTRHIGVDRVQKVWLQTLKTEFEMLKMKEDDSIDEFSTKLNSIVTRASGLGSTFDQQTLVRKLLSSVPKRFIQIMATIEQFTDLEETTLDETIGFKNGGHERFRSYQDNKQDEKTKQFNNEKKPSHKFKRNNFQKGTKDSSKVKCYNCNKFGHVRRNCKLKDKGQEQSNLVQEDVEPTLLMAVQEKGDKGEKIFLNEKEIKPKKYISTDESLWYLDNGASNHMTVIRTHFKEVDEKISGRVRFGDGSYVKIKGKYSRASFPNQTNTKSSEPLDLVFGDLCGPISSETKSGKKYMFLLVDDCTRTDRGGEFTSREFTRYCKENDILKQLTAPYSPQQNGIVERRNRVPTKALKDSTPYEALKNRKPNMRHLRVFGCKAYAKVTKPHLKKDVKFKEDEGWDWKGYLDNINPSEPELGDFIISENQTSSSRIIDEVSTQDSERNDEDNNPSTPPPYTYEPNSEDSTGYTSSIASSSRPFDHTPVRGYRNLSEIYDRAPEVQSDELLLLEEEPRNYKEAAQDKKWIEAMKIEIDSINKNKTWKLATLPDNQKAIAKGYVQEHGIDYDEVFAPIARMETVRLILALSAYHGWEVNHIDVKSAFLHGELKEEVYVTQPEGFKKPGNENKVYRLVKALYGLKQAPRAWNMKPIGFIKHSYSNSSAEIGSYNLCPEWARTEEGEKKAF